MIPPHDPQSDRPAGDAQAPGPGHLANAGIRLMPDPIAQGLVAVALCPGGDDRHLPLMDRLPCLPEDLVLEACAFLRDLWHRSGVLGCWCLYLDWTSRAWVAVLPPQQCLPAATRIDLACVDPALIPPPHWRLAGTLAAVSVESLACLPLPPFAGVHVAYAPDAAGWLDLVVRVVNRAGDAGLPLPPARAIAPRPRSFEALHARIRLAPHP